MAQIEKLKEVTKGFPQNIYYVSGDRLVAYHPAGKPTAFCIYDKPMRFDKRYRKFEVLEKNCCL